MNRPVDRAPNGAPAGWLRALWPREPAGRLCVLLVAVLWVYAAGFSGWLARQWLSGLHGDMPAWTLMLPPQALTALVIWRLLSRVTGTRARRVGWWLLLAATVVDTLAVGDWSYVISATGQPFGSAADLLYMLNYALLAAAVGAFFVSCGGSFMRARVWIDAATLVFGAVAALMPFLFSPLFDPASPYHANVMATLGYTLGIGVTATAALLLFMQVMDWQRDQAMALLMLGIAAILVTDVLSVAANVRGQFQVGNLDDLGYCWSYVCIASAALIERRRGEPAPRTPTAAGNVYSFLPVTAILLCIVIVLGLEARHTDISLLTAAALLFLSAVLLVARQLGVRFELRHLNEKLAARAADARLTELVRRSADLIVVVNSTGVVTYASPAAESVLGRAAETLVDCPVNEMLGAENAGHIAALLDELRRAAGSGAELELRGKGARGRPVVAHLIGSNEFGNPLINGIVLTVRDVTAQRATEREVLDVASRERQRLAAEVHEGIGQDLAAVALMLKGLASGADGDGRPVREALRPIVAEVNRTIRSLRALARGLSPLGVAHGSLLAALRAHAADVEERYRIPVRLRAQATAIEGTPAAEHLYYVAHEAISRAVHRRQCSRIDVDLRAAGATTVLTVSDDGLGDPADEPAADELTLRMMGYRARLIAGTLQITTRADAGSRVELTVPEARAKPR